MAEFRNACKFCPERGEWFSAHFPLLLLPAVFRISKQTALKVF